MKKLFLMAAVVCAAVAAQAHTTWTLCIENFKDHTGESVYSGDAKLYVYLAEGGESSATEIHTASVEDGGAYSPFDSEDLSVETEYTFYFTAEEDGWTFRSGPVTAYKESWEEWGLTQIIFNSPTDNATWTVPEPTSGVLLLLGLAGLALKRKRTQRECKEN